MSLYKLLIYTCLMVVLLSCNNKSGNGKIPEVDSELMNSGEPEINALNDAIADDPNNPLFYYKRAKIYYETGHIFSAKKDINTAIHLDSTSIDNYVLLAKVYNKMNRLHLALKTAIMAEELNSNDPELFILMSQIYIVLGNEKKSEYYFNKASVIAPFHSDIFVLKGKMAAMKGDTAVAISNLLGAIRKDVRNIDSYKELVMIYDAQHKYDSAMMLLIKGRGINNREPAFYFYEGKFFENFNLKNSAKTSYAMALNYDSTFFQAYYYLGLLNLREGDYSSALKNFVNVVRYEPNLKQANLYAAELYEQLNFGESAIPYYQRVLNIDSSNGKAKEALERLYKLYPEKRKVAVSKDTIKGVMADTSMKQGLLKEEAKQEIKKEVKKKPLDSTLPKKDSAKIKNKTEVIPEVKKEEAVKEEVVNPPNTNSQVTDTDTSKTRRARKKRLKKDTIQ
jgi:tetratricopeptide (TPR) repeat protein